MIALVNIMNSYRNPQNPYHDDLGEWPPNPTKFVKYEQA